MFAITRSIGFLLVFLVGMLPIPGLAGEVLVAQAANFLKPMEEIGAAFDKATGHRVRISAGSTGTLYAQIKHGAPFDVFLAADRRRPKLLEEEGLAVPGSRFTYAVGRLTLWSRDPDRMTGDGAGVLRQGSFDHLALANPKTAPFGSAAVQTLEKLGLHDNLQSKIVQGENVGQAFQFVFSGNAELGFVSLSQVLDPRIDNVGSRWDVPQELYDPLKMDAVQLKRSGGNAAARSLLEFVKGEEARAIIERYGYSMGRSVLIGDNFDRDISGARGSCRGASPAVLAPPAFAAAPAGRPAVSSVRPSAKAGPLRCARPGARSPRHPRALQLSIITIPGPG